jgi:HlyD family secretion protein
MKKKFLLIPVIVLIAVVAYKFYDRREEAPRDKLFLYGNVDIREVQLAFQDTGRIQTLAVDEGDEVRSGQLVATLDPVRYRYAVEQLTAQVEAQQQLLDRLLAGSRPQEIEKARADVSARQARLVDAERTYRRIRNLSLVNQVSKQQLDNAESTLKTARADLAAARQALSLAIEGPRKQDIARARATLKALQASLGLAEQKLKDTKLYAPENGIIRNRILEPGAMAFASRPVFTLALINPVWVRAYVPEPDLGKIREGMTAEITTDSFPGKTYRGWIGFISPTAEFTPKTVETPELRTKLVYRVRVFACNPRNELRLGMPVTVTVDLARQPASSAHPPCKESGKSK